MYKMNNGDGYHGWARKWLRKCSVYVFRVRLEMPIVCLTEALKAIAWWKIQVNFYLCSVVQSLGKKQSWLKVLTVILDTEKLFLCQVYLIFFFPHPWIKVTIIENIVTQSMKLGICSLANVLLAQHKGSRRICH